MAKLLFEGCGLVAGYQTSKVKLRSSFVIKLFVFKRSGSVAVIVVTPTV